MADVEDELVRQVWKGEIPVVFSISESDITTLSPPSPLYMMIPRMSYFPVVATKVFEYFQEYAPPASSARTTWYEYNGIPLKWHRPFGVLFDLYTDPTCQSRIPWEIRVHFQEFPEKQLLPCDNLSIVEAHYMNTLKQAFFAMYGSVKYIMEMPQALQAQLWTGVRSNSYDIYHQAYANIVPKEGVRRVLPIRVLLINEEPIQLPISPTVYRTLADLLQYLLPDIESPMVMIQGIPVALEAPIEELYQVFAHPDQFLYVIVKESKRG